MKRSFFSLLLILCQAWQSQGATIESANDCQIITFDEPIVRYSELQKPTASNITFSGDANHTPTARWIDQDTLCVKLKQGTPIAAKYQLRFKPGQDTYLGGERIEPAMLELSCPPSELVVDKMEGYPANSFCVYPLNRLSRESIDFSPAAGVSYEFREVFHEKGKVKGHGRTIPAQAHPAMLRQIPNQQAALQQLAYAKANWENVTGETHVPGFVIVSPTETLDENATWELHIRTTENCGLIYKEPTGDLLQKRLHFRPDAELGTGVIQFITRPTQEEKQQGKKPEMRLKIKFSAPVSETDFPAIFNKMVIRCGDQTATNTPDGNAKILNVNGKETTFCIAKEKGEEATEPAPFYTKKNGQPCRISYEGARHYHGMYIAMSDMHPGELDIIIPQGTAAAGGLATKCNHHHRISITPAYPQLGLGATQLPAKGDHHFRILSMNAASLEMKAWHMRADQLLALQINGKDLPIEENKNILERLQFRLKAEEKRLEIVPGTTDGQYIGSATSIRNSIHSTQRKNEQKLAQIHETLRSLTAFKPKRIELPQPDNATQQLLYTHEAVVNLDTLTDGNTQPGYYIISIKPHPSETARKLAESMGADPAIFETEHFMPIQVTDLCCSAAGGKLLVSSLQDGSIIQEADVYAADGTKSQLSGGCYNMPDESPAVLVAVGNDYTLVNNTRRNRRQRTSETMRHEIFADRPLYRPGDTVHLRGVVRHVSTKGDATIPTQAIPLLLTITKPNREILHTQEFTADDFGAWDADFTLPTGDEDTTGTYRVNVRIPGNMQAPHQLGIPCQVFRRDAFETQLQINIPPIAPRQFTATIQATDLNGTPLSNAEVELNLHCSHNMLAQHPEHAYTNSLKLKGRTDNQGKLEISGHISDTFPPEAGGMAHMTISGSVANDRQEYKKLNTLSHTFYAADFVAVAEGQHLRLLDVTSKGKNPLGREQKIHVHITADAEHRQTYPGGIVIYSEQKKCLFNQEITLSPHDKDGFLLPLDKKEEYNNIRIHVTGTDKEGRKLEALLPWHPWWRKPVQTPHTASPQFTPDEHKIIWEVDGSRAGEAILFIHSRQGSRLQQLQLRGGKETLHIPLQANENGNVRCQLLQTVQDDNGLYTQWNDTTQNCHIPRKDMQLQVELLPPKQDVRPSSTVDISGKVTLPDGSPAKAEVTLFAVDAGMLSVAPYTLPDWQERFGRVTLPIMIFPPLQWQGASAQFSKSFVLMSAVWEGDLINNGRYIPLAEPIHRTGFHNFFSYFDSEEIEDGAVSPNRAMGVMAAPSPVMTASGATKRSVSGPDAIMEETATDEATEAPRIRTNFAPLAVWQAALQTNDKGEFSTSVNLPDTLTTWRVFAVAIDKSGQRFANAETEFKANLPVMLSPGAPLFMSLGDKLRLPLTITNNSGQNDTWSVHQENSPHAQQITLKSGSTGTLFFDYTADTEGKTTLRWHAKAPAGGDAVECQFPVRFPAPVLKEIHHIILTAGEKPLIPGKLPAPELANSPRSNTEIELSANPLLHLSACMDFMLNYPYGCTEQTASALLPWMFHQRLAPFSPSMAAHDAAAVHKLINKSIEILFSRQQTDGGLSYWGTAKDSCLWASAHAALVLTIAEEQGYPLPDKPMENLRNYLASQDEDTLSQYPALTLYSIGKVCNNPQLIERGLRQALDEKHTHPRWLWCRTSSVEADIRFITELRNNPTNRHAALTQWLRSRGHDYRHNTTWHNAWMLIALGEYLRQEPAQQSTATVCLQDGQQITLNNGITRLSALQTTTPAELPTTINTTHGTAYINIKFRALPSQINYPGITEKGLQITRVYEKKNEMGNWEPCTEFTVGDIVRITLTCAKVANELQYFVLEDYLPACMEVINPEVPGQAAGLDWQPWSFWFDHKEYLADRVRGFCTRWGGRNILNMSYFARVKRAGTSTAPPAQAQLMYEPQVYGLSPNTKIISK